MRSDRHLPNVHCRQVLMGRVLPIRSGPRPIMGQEVRPSSSRGSAATPGWLVAYAPACSRMRRGVSMPMRSRFRARLPKTIGSILYPSESLLVSSCTAFLRRVLQGKERSRHVQQSVRLDVPRTTPDAQNKSGETWRDQGRFGKVHQLYRRKRRPFIQLTILQLRYRQAGSSPKR